MYKTAARFLQKFRERTSKDPGLGGLGKPKPASKRGKGKKARRDTSAIIVGEPILIKREALRESKKFKQSRELKGKKSATPPASGKSSTKSSATEHFGATISDLIRSKLTGKSKKWAAQ